jgi:hemolysin activation/secretion protein
MGLRGNLSGVVVGHGWAKAVLSIATGVSLALPVCAFAQAAPAVSRTAPESLAPIRREADNSIALPDQAGPSIPAGAEDITVTIGEVAFEGLGGDTPHAVAAQVEQARRDLGGRKVTVAALYQTAAQIEATFARSGQILTRVTLPPQHIADGQRVRFLVVQGFIESVDVSSLPRNVRGVVASRLASLVNARGLSLAQIERRVLLAGDVPGVRLRSTLLRGEAPGAARLVINGEFRPVSVDFGFSNNLGAVYQYNAFTLQLAVNSPFGLGEQIYGLVTTSSDFDNLFTGNPRRRILGAGAVIPVGANGLTLNPEYLLADTTPRAASVQTAGLFERFALRASYPLVRSRRESLTIGTGFEVTRERQTAPAFNLDLLEDRLRIITGDLGYGRSIGTALRVDSTVRLSVGLAGLGARSAADAKASGIPLSRQGADPDFRKIETTLRADYRAASAVNLGVVVRGQASFTGALPAAAQFSLDGAESLSSFAQGSLNVDSGITGRAEISRPFAFSGKPASIVTPYLFGAVGYGHLSAPTALEVADLHSWSLGGGLRLALSKLPGGLSSFAALEVSHGHVTTMTSDPTRVLASFNIHF